MTGKKSNWVDWSRVIRVPINRYSGWSGSGVNITLGKITIWLSGTKVIAFREKGFPIVISENLWGNMSGYHFNCIDPDKKIRIPYGEFRKKLNEALNNNGIFTELKGMDDNIIDDVGARPYMW